MHLIDNPAAETRDLMDFVSGPDFPTGGLVVDARETILAAYESGRGSFRLRARAAQEKGKGGGWDLVVTEIPYGVQKAKLIEQIAELIANKKLPILADVRDESAEDLRIVLEPRSRTVDPTLLLESLYRLTDLEIRFPLNLNVLDQHRTPGVMGLKSCLTAWLAFQIEVLLNRSRTRVGKIEDRLELLDGFLIAYLNLDRVIEIIRTEDEPKAIMMAEFDLSDRQAEAILNMRLRSLRRLEELEIAKERAALAKERDDLLGLIESPRRQRNRLKKELEGVRAKFGDARRTTIEEKPLAARAEIDWSAMIEKEPITVILSARGWIRALKGHLAAEEFGTLKFREGDELWGKPLHAQTTDKVLIAGENGRVYTIGGDKLPGGRGFGEPLRLSLDLPAEVEIVAMLVVKPSARLLAASSDGRGFLTSGEAVLAETRKGKQLMNLRPGAKLQVLRPVPDGVEAVAVIGDNRKLLVFNLAELPEMGRGSGVQLQRYRDGGLADVALLKAGEGLSWSMGGDSGRTRTEGDLTPWKAIRGASGRMAPLGFPRSNRFQDV
jgi:topoisomerase-4 subunit A